jgi:hypothetical protein
MPTVAIFASQQIEAYIELRFRSGFAAKTSAAAEKIV